MKFVRPGAYIQQNKEIPLNLIFENLLNQYVGEIMTEETLYSLKLAIARIIADLARKSLIPEEYASKEPDELFCLMVDGQDVTVGFRDDRLRELLAVLLAEGMQKKKSSRTNPLPRRIL